MPEEYIPTAEPSEIHQYQYDAGLDGTQATQLGQLVCERWFTDPGGVRVDFLLIDGKSPVTTNHFSWCRIGVLDGTGCIQTDSMSSVFDVHVSTSRTIFEIERAASYTYEGRFMALLIQNADMPEGFITYGNQKLGRAQQSVVRSLERAERRAAKSVRKAGRQEARRVRKQLFASHLMERLGIMPEHIELLAQMPEDAHFQ
ncbi:MAG TPA: hypothetical protein VFN56_05525 [Candidatus Saccharimonadales bacterium]|nr:hypothetical protein [Candidatus Saccharimonadales bacterium]